MNRIEIPQRSHGENGRTKMQMAGKEQKMQINNQLICPIGKIYAKQKLTFDCSRAHPETLGYCKTLVGFHLRWLTKRVHAGVFS